MREDDLKDFSQFLGELQRETDRGLALVGAALIDEKLLQTLSSYFCECKASKKLLLENNPPLGSFSARIDTCYALALIDEFEYKEATIIRKVRNEFAHSTHGTNFQTEKISAFCANLKSDLPEGTDHPINESRFRYSNSVISMANRLFYRPEWVAKERRTPKEWVSPDNIRWRSIEEESPPKNAPVLVIGKTKRGNDSNGG